MNSICDQIDQNLCDVECLSCEGTGQDIVATVTNCGIREETELTCSHCKGTGIGIEFKEIDDLETRHEYEDIFYKVLKILQNITNHEEDEQLHDAVNRILDILNIVPRANVVSLSGGSMALIEIADHGIMIRNGKVICVY